MYKLTLAIRRIKDMMIVQFLFAADLRSIGSVHESLAGL